MYFTQNSFSPHITSRWLLLWIDDIDRHWHYLLTLHYWLFTLIIFSHLPPYLFILIALLINSLIILIHYYSFSLASLFHYFISHYIAFRAEINSHCYWWYRFITFDIARFIFITIATTPCQSRHIHWLLLLAVRCHQVIPDFIHWHINIIPLPLLRHLHSLAHRHLQASLRPHIFSFPHIYLILTIHLIHFIESSSYLFIIPLVLRQKSSSLLRICRHIEPLQLGYYISHYYCVSWFVLFHYWYYAWYFIFRLFDCHYLTAALAFSSFHSFQHH